MPTAQDYEHAAQQLRALADRCDTEVAAAPRSAAARFAGPGTARATIDTLVATAVRALATASDDLRRLSRECLRRAVVCHEYQRDVATYHGLPPTIRAHVPRPVRPASWVD